MPTNRMCPHCRAFVDRKLKTCPYCEGDLSRKAGWQPRSPSFPSGSLSGASFVTILLLLINAGLFAACWILSMRFAGDGTIDGQVLHMLGAKFRLSILLHGEWWRLITANFLHGGFLHILFNSMSLVHLGPTCEEIFGTPRFVVLYLGTGVCGFLASTYWSSSLSVGASASICGMIGALYGFSRISFNSQLKGLALRWVIAIGVFGILVPSIDNAAHLGGLLAGFGFAYAVGTPESDPSTERVWTGISIGAVAIAAWAFLMAYRNLSVSTY